MRVWLIAIICFSFVSQVHAAQPISVSLAECSVIYNVTSITAEQKGKPEEQITAMRKMADTYRDDAYKAAQSEGHKDGRAYIDERLPALIEKWDERWLTEDHFKALSLMKENMEWVDYCAKLGKERHLIPLAD